MYFTESKVKVKVFKVHVFVASFSGPLSFCVSDYDRKIKEKSRSAVLYSYQILHLLMTFDIHRIQKVIFSYYRFSYGINKFKFKPEITFYRMEFLLNIGKYIIK